MFEKIFIILDLALNARSTIFKNNLNIQPVPVRLPALPLNIPRPPFSRDSRPLVPIVLPRIQDIATPQPEKIEENKELEKAYGTLYSDENSEKTDSESELATIESETIDTPSCLQEMVTTESGEQPSEETNEKTVIEKNSERENSVEV